MKVNIDGAMYEYDPTRMSMTEAYELKERTGYGMRALQYAYNDLEPDACRWIAYIAKKRAGEKVEWDSFDFDLAGMIVSIEQADDEPAPKDEAAAPSEDSPATTSA